MTLRHLKIFVAVFQNQSVTKASRELHLAQPSVSLAIRELEEYYGICLFDRIGRTIAPTEGGREFYGYAVHIVGLFDEMEKKIRNWDAIGILRVGSSITIGTHILPELLKRFQERYPGLRVEAVIGSSASVEEKLLHNEVDIGLVENTPEQPDILAEAFMDDSLCAIAAPGHPLAGRKKVRLRELAEYPLLMREKGSAVRDVFDHGLYGLGLSAEPACTSVNTQALVRLAEEGLGAAVLPEPVAEPEVQAGRLVQVPVDGLSMENRMRAAWVKERTMTSQMKRLMELIQKRT